MVQLYFIARERNSNSFSIPYTILYYYTLLHTLFYMDGAMMRLICVNKFSVNFCAFYARTSQKPP